MMIGLLQDLRYALRQLRKSPGFTAVAVLTLGLGIGANTAIFSLVNGVLLEPLGFSQQDRLVQLTDSYPEGALVAIRRTFRTMDVAGYRDGNEMNLTGAGEPMRLHGTAVSANFFSLLSVRPESGRGFREGEDEPGNDNFVILSHALWREEFGNDPSAVGRSVMLGGVSRQIIGVMPADFQLGSSQPQFWVPLHLDAGKVGEYWGTGFMPLVGRMRPGVTLEQAYAELRAQIPQMRRMFPWRMPDSFWASATVAPLQQSLVSDARTKLMILLGAVSLVLLIACANVANLLLARAAARQKELAVRAAVGAGRWRVCRQLLTESLLLGALGGVAGLLLGVGGLSFLKALLPNDTPRLRLVGLDWRVMTFTAGVALLTGLLFGIAPALQASRIDLTESVKAGWQRSATAAGRRLRGALAIAEISLAVVLVISAGLTVKSLWELSRVHPGFRSESILTARVTPNDNLCEGSARCRNLYSELLEQVQALPGVQGAAVVNVLPMTGRIDAFAAGLEDHPQDPGQPAPVIFETVISADYFLVMGVPILQGRGFTALDSEPLAPPVGLITASTAQKYWPNENPLGKHVKRVSDKEWVTIVGVVGDVNEYSLAARFPGFVEGAIYRPYGNGTGNLGGHGPTQPTEMTLVVRTPNDPASLSGELRRTVTSINSEVPLSEMLTLRTVVLQSLAAPRSTMALFAIFAALALLLGAVGVYGVISYGVAQRLPEIGMRMALGARKLDVMWLVMEQGGRLGLVGVGVGVAGAIAGTRLISSLLFAVSATDFFTYSAVSFLLISVTLAACYIPARRATKVDPMTALRYE
jgi:predicted permease